MERACPVITARQACPPQSHGKMLPPMLANDAAIIETASPRVKQISRPCRGPRRDATCFRRRLLQNAGQPDRPHDCGFCRAAFRRRFRDDSRTQPHKPDCEHSGERSRGPSRGRSREPYCKRSIEPGLKACCDGNLRSGRPSPRLSGGRSPGERLASHRACHPLSPPTA